jgi:RNA polymerase sigma factor (sigma-70 family)
MHWRKGPPDEFRSKKEVSWPLRFDAVARDDGSRLDSYDPPGLMMQDIPETDMVALMEAAPGVAEAESLVAQQELREVMAHAWEQMDPREQWVLGASLNRSMSLRAIATELGLSKTQVHRILVAAKRNLALALADEPVVQSRLR